MTQITTMAVRRPSWLQRYLAPVPDRVIPWSGPEIVLGILLAWYFLPLLVLGMLQVSGFYRAMYGPEITAASIDVASTIGLGATPETELLAGGQGTTTVETIQHLIVRLQALAALVCVAAAVDCSAAAAVRGKRHQAGPARPDLAARLAQRRSGSDGGGGPDSPGLCPLLRDPAAIQALGHWRNSDPSFPRSGWSAEADRVVAIPLCRAGIGSRHGRIDAAGTVATLAGPAPLGRLACCGVGPGHGHCLSSDRLEGSVGFRRLVEIRHRAAARLVCAGIGVWLRFAALVWC